MYLSYTEYIHDSEMKMYEIIRQSTFIFKVFFSSSCRQFQFLLSVSCFLEILTSVTVQGQTSEKILHYINKMFGDQNGIQLYVRDNCRFICYRAKLFFSYYGWENIPPK